VKRIAPITFTRAEYSSFVPVLKALRDAPGFETQLLVSGTHLSPQFGNTVEQIEADGFSIADRIPMEIKSDTPEAVTRAVGLVMGGFAQSFARLKPDLLLLVGDRLELIAPATAALAARIPVAHISGGDLTEGAIDNQVRYAITQMSHLHFVAMQEHADRLLRMGEEPWRVHVVGEPALDLLKDMRLLSRHDLAKSLGVELKPPVLVVTHHPTTLGTTSAGEEIESLIQALEQIQGTLVITMPNADVEWQTVLARLREFVSRRSSARLYSSLGALRYYSLLSHADLMVGNSSSGIWESPSFKIPVVNIGDRQRGRHRAGNVIDVPCAREQIFNGIQRALTREFRESLANLANPYGDGKAGARILNILKNLDVMPELRIKSFTFTNRI
jgi:GDP/UDP-N,N'-diacetylbacillosamine 2-epimerase (hydrolysing)